MRLLLLVVLAATGCSTTAVRPAPPTVDCRQPAPRPVTGLPAAGEWVEWVPEAGAARLSEKAALFVKSVLLERARDRQQWQNQEDCLDGYDKAGTIKR